MVLDLKHKQKVLASGVWVIDTFFPKISIKWETTTRQSIGMILEVGDCYNSENIYKIHRNVLVSS